MKLFSDELKIIRIDNIFPMFLVESNMRYSVKVLNDNGLNFSDKLFGGWGNGYVGLPKWHPYYKLHYDNIPINIHGGLTFSELDEDEDLWVIGFDTNHFMDDIVKWSFENVKEETEHLMNQCLNIKEVQRILKLNKLNILSNG